MPLIGIERLAEPRGKGGRLLCGVQVRDVAERCTAELRDALPALFGVDRRHRRGRGAGNAAPDGER